MSAAITQRLNKKELEMNASTTGGYMERLRAIAAAARTTGHAHSARDCKRDTTEDARRKVAKKLRDNRAYFLDKVNVQKPDCVYKAQSDGRYTIGLKYGQRYLAGVFDGDKYIADVGKDELPEVLSLLATEAEAGEFDTQINVIMQANVAAKNKH
jgi:hypothetical protein